MKQNMTVYISIDTIKFIKKEAIRRSCKSCISNGQIIEEAIDLYKEKHGLQDKKWSNKR